MINYHQKLIKYLFLIKKILENSLICFYQYPILNNLNTIITEPNSLLSNNKLSTDLYDSEYYLNIHIQFENGSLIQSYFTRLYFIFQIAYSFYNNIIIHLVPSDLNNFDSISIFDYSIYIFIFFFLIHFFSPFIYIFFLLLFSLFIIIFIHFLIYLIDIRICYLNNNECDNLARSCLSTLNNFIINSIQSLRFTNYEYKYGEKCHYISDNSVSVNKERINTMNEIYNGYINQSVINDETKKFVIKSVIQRNVETNSFVISELITEVHKIQNNIYMEVNRVRFENNMLVYNVKFSDNRDWKRFLSTIPSIIEINEA